MRRETVLGTARGGVGVIVSGVTGYLRDGATLTPESAAKILASVAVALRNGVLATNVVAGVHHHNEKVDKEAKTQNLVQKVKEQVGTGDIIDRVAIGIVRRRSANRNNCQEIEDQVEGKGHNKDDDDLLEGSCGLGDASWNSIPVQPHPLHNLTRGNYPI